MCHFYVVGYLRKTRTYIGIYSVSIAGFYVPFTYLPKAAIEKGITRENAAFLLSIIGINTRILRAYSHQTNMKTKKIKQQAKEIKEKTFKLQTKFSLSL